MKSVNSFAGKVRVRASALIIADGSLLLVNQKVPTRKHPVWLPPGGAVELGEFSAQSVKREVFEETNLVISGLILKYVHEFVEPPYHAVEFYYNTAGFEGELKTGYDPELNPENQLLLKAEFISFDELDNLNVYPEFLKAEINSDNVQIPGIRHF